MAKKPPPQVEQAARELLRRRHARKNFIDFIPFVMPDFEIGPHHLFVADTLQKVFDGKIKRLIIEAPPRHCRLFGWAIVLPIISSERPIMRTLLPMNSAARSAI
jgi:hypothetical protein